MTALKVKKAHARMTPAEARDIVETDLRWKQVDLAMALGVSHRTVQHYLNPKRKEVPGPVAVLLRLWQEHRELWPPFISQSRRSLPIAAPLPDPRIRLKN